MVYSKYMIQELFSSDDIFENSLHTREMIHQELKDICQRELKSKLDFYNFLKKYCQRDSEVKLVQRQIEQLVSFMKLL